LLSQRRKQQAVGKIHHLNFLIAEKKYALLLFFWSSSTEEGAEKKNALLPLSA
jgi:hypothetical protein